MATLPSPNPGPPVSAYMRVVANGVAEDGRIKATLIVTPQSPANGVATDLNLPTWPGDIVRHLAGLAKSDKFPVWYSLTDPSSGAVTPARLEKPRFSALADGEIGLSEVNGLWAKAFTGSGASNPWQTLLADIDRSVNGQKSSADLQAAYPSDPRTADILDNGAIVAQPHDPAQKTVVKGVVPNPQTGYAIDTAAARAQRVTRKLAIGPYLPGDQDEILGTQIPNPDLTKFADDRKGTLLTRLKQSVDATNADRQRSKDGFDKVKAALGDPPPPATPAATPAPIPAMAAAVASLSIIAPAVQVLGRRAAGDGPAPSRAGHVYGSWAQWSPRHSDASALTAKARAEGAPPSKPKGPPADPMATLVSIYYSLQGDPILSRLFGFAFDIEFDISAGIQHGGDIWLAAGDTPSSIWTKARYAVQEGEDKTRRFWPAPRFEKTDVSVALTREQIHGIFDLGQGYDQVNPKPRYYLTSLAVRGAVSESLDGIETVDKGERHQTIGWTLLDSGRAGQTARDLAVASHQRKTHDDSKAVVLHAEELTIGRRLDVMAVGPKQKKRQWRSLMNRFVEFANLPSAAKDRLDAIVVDRLQKGKGRIFDEAAFQLVSRSMPIVGDQGSNQDGSRNVEAIVEEAFQSWDGTPLASLACKSTANGSGSEVLPVKRAYDLPTSDFPDLRPPPLRYGVGYVFSIRSEFLGGGSPSLDEATRWHAAKGGEMTLPPSDKNGVKPRRFLRQEAIAAPILMLPDNLVTGSNGEMGFDSSVRAVVRTATAPDKLAIGEATESPPGPDYVQLAQRARPDSTMRVFIAPRAGVDFCARHGVFDNSSTALQRLGGGLLDVEFHVGKKAQSFPVAVVTRNTGFNADRLIYRRDRSQSTGDIKDGDSLGGTIFRPLPAPANREGGRSYLPDPAAETMSVRLRVRGSDKYLKNDVLVELYPKGVDVDYPNTLPLVVTVEKISAQRAKPAEFVTDILLGNPNAIVRIRENGVLGSDTPGAGVRARHLRVVLAPGEQFDLEVTCLPSATKLAQWFSLPENIGVQHRLAQFSPAVATALCLSCGQLQTNLTAAVANAEPAAQTGLGGYAPPDESGLAAVAKELLDCIRGRWQLTEVAGTTTLTVEHAISAPLNAVSLAKVAILRPDTPTPAAPMPVASAEGSSTLLLTGELLVDLEQVSAVDIVAEVVNPNGTPFDDPARGRGVLAKRAGRWPTGLSDESKRQYRRKRAVFGFDVDANGKATLLPQTVTLLRIQNLPDPRAAVNPTAGPPIFLDPEPWKLRRARLDLAALDWAARNAEPILIPVASDGHPDQSGNPVPTRGIGVSRPHEISDTRARHVKLYAVAVSRFARTFETAPMFSDDGKEHLLHRRQPLRDSEQRKTGEAVAAWSGATARPAPAAARTPTPFFAIKRSAEKDRGLTVQTLIRKCGVRLRFDRGMFSAGEGERIGVVLWPPDIVKQNPGDLEDNTVRFAGRTMTLSDFVDADLGDGGQFISRWGGDPIRSDPTPQRGWFMPPTAFAYLNPAEAGEPQAHDPKYVPSVNMPIIVAKPAGSDDGASAESLTFMQVALLTFEPYFDIDAEEWFVDVAMDAARATDPFIRLGLVRYQPNTINGELKASTPVRVWTQLPPRRTLTVTPRPTENGGLAVHAVVCGQASDGIKPLPDDAAEVLLNGSNAEAAAAHRAVWNRLQRARMVLKVLHETEDDNFGKRQTNIFPSEAIDFDDGMMNDGIMTWSISVTIPRLRLNDLGPGRLVAIVEEIEERLPATYPNEPIKLTDLLQDDVVLQSSPRFIARVPFFESK